MPLLVAHIESLSQAKAAQVLRIAQPRLNLLTRGHGASFSIDILANLSACLGLNVRLSVTRA